MKIDMPLLFIAQENTKRIPKEDIVTWDIGNELPVRAAGEFTERSFYLDSYYDWIVGYDSDGSKILVALNPREDENSQGTLEEKA